MKQSSKFWYKNAHRKSIGQDFTPSKSDDGVISGRDMCVLFYVDEIVIMGINLEETDTAKQTLSLVLEIKDFGIFRDFLCIFGCWKHEGYLAGAGCVH